MPYEPPPAIASLSLPELAEAIAARKLPPVEQWAPAQLGESHMHIHADGRWYHEEGEIHRPAMIRAFASLLNRDESGQYWLTTPVQKLAIAVDDAPFIATDMTVSENAIVFRLNTDDLVIAGPDYPLVARGTEDNPAIYLKVRHGCEARLNRSTWLQLAEHALEQGEDMKVCSQGAEFALIPQ
ncbi:MAG: DUF1285 domain-containing protein [Sphingomonadaceae bacterium]